MLPVQKKTKWELHLIEVAKNNPHLKSNYQRRELANKLWYEKIEEEKKRKPEDMSEYQKHWLKIYYAYPELRTTEERDAKARELWLLRSKTLHENIRYNNVNRKFSNEVLEKNKNRIEQLKKLHDERVNKIIYDKEPKITEWQKHYIQVVKDYPELINTNSRNIKARNLWLKKYG